MVSLLFTRYKPVPFVIPNLPSEAWLRPLKCDSKEFLRLNKAKLATPLPPLGVVLCLPVFSQFGYT